MAQGEGICSIARLEKYWILVLQVGRQLGKVQEFAKFSSGLLSQFHHDGGVLPALQGLLSPCGGYPVHCGTFGSIPASTH